MAQAQQHMNDRADSGRRAASPQCQQVIWQHSRLERRQFLQCHRGKGDNPVLEKMALGKSTLMKILSGVIQPNQRRELFLDGKPINFVSSTHARKPRHFDHSPGKLSLAPNLTVRDKHFHGP